METINTDNEALEYELIDISIEYDEADGADTIWMARDASDDEAISPEIVCDAEGIPMGTSMEEIRMREAMIADFLSKWRETNPEGRILNEALNEYIYFRNISFTEAREHSSKGYKSTRALMLLDEVMKKALPVGRTAVKASDNNQGSFVYMLIMVYRHDELGTIKVTVGVRLSGQRIQYGITALRPGEPLIKREPKQDRKKKRNPRK